MFGLQMKNFCRGDKTGSPICYPLWKNMGVKLMSIGFLYRWHHDHSVAGGNGFQGRKAKMFAENALGRTSNYMLIDLPPEPTR
jgi:hypothetical protein